MLKLLCWCAPVLALPCLNSSMDCLETLTQRAINRSSEIKAINEQLELTAQRQDYAEARQWTNYLTLDPIRLVQNVLGGGDVQRRGLEIASLELDEADLIRQRENQAQQIADDVVGLVLSYEKLGREYELLHSRLQTHLLQVQVMEAQYRTGQGSTSRMLTMWQRTDDMKARCDEKRIGQAQDRRELEILTGADAETQIYPALIGVCGHGDTSTIPRATRDSA
ncbi:TolC family protein [Adonisia turfae]|nr:TolC family protein [Adonisia turfae]